MPTTIVLTAVAGGGERAALAAKLARDLGDLAVEAEWSTAPTAGQDEGHYTDPITDAMGEVGIDDLSEASTAQARKIRRLALLGCLDRLEMHYSASADLQTGPVAERYGQLAVAVGRVRASVVGRVAVGVTLPGRVYPDWSAAEGTAE